MIIPLINFQKYHDLFFDRPCRDNRQRKNVFVSSIYFGCRLDTGLALLLIITANLGKGIWHLLFGNGVLVYEDAATAVYHNSDDVCPHFKCTFI